MILGVFGEIFGYAVGGVLAELAGETTTMVIGLGMAFLFSIMYAVVEL